MMPLARSKTVLACLMSSLALSACGEVRKIDEMRTNTGEMNKTTKELLDATGDMKTTTEGMGKTTDVMSQQTGELLKLTEQRLIPRIESMDGATAVLHDDLRQGDAATLRREFLESLLHSNTLQNRLAEAGLFLMSFEYQLFVNSDRHPQEERHMLYHQAMMEFMLRLDELAPKHGKVWPDAMPDVEDDEATKSAENRASAFASFAAALHKVNRKQGPDHDFGRPASVYDLMIASLKAKPQLDRGELVLPAGQHYMKEILSRQDRVKQLLQTRYNMFVYLLLGSTTDMVESGPVGQAFRVAKGIKINLDSSNMGVGHLDFIIEEILNPAIETRKDMIAVGLDPQLTMKTQLVANRIKMISSKEPGPMADKQRLILELWSTYLGHVKDESVETK